MDSVNNSIIDDFCKIYYNPIPCDNTFWMGVQTQKCPLDLWIYQEIMFEVKPDVIIECGTYKGGTSLYLSSICEILEHGEVITIDKDRVCWHSHPRMTRLRGSTISEEVLANVNKLLVGKNRVMVILDSSHVKSHVMKELEIYSKYVSVGSYIIVEDTIVNGHPVWPDFGDGPMEAVEEFLEKDNRFIIDHSKEKFYLTFNRNGYLKRVQ